MRRRTTRRAWTVALASALFLPALLLTAAPSPGQLDLRVSPEAPGPADVITLTFDYLGTCFERSTAVREGNVLRVTAIEDFVCPILAPVVPITFQERFEFLPVDLYAVELFIDPCGGVPIAPPCNLPTRLAATWPLAVTSSGIVKDVTARMAEDGATELVFDLHLACLNPFFDVRSATDDTLWIEMDLGAQPICIPEISKSLDLGALAPGEYKILLFSRPSNTGSSPILELPWSFTVPELPLAELLLANRFRVSTRWDDGGGPVAAQARTLTDRSGYFWFFGEDNVELTVKALDGCAVNGHHWIFAAGLTNVAVEMLVEDTFTGTTRTYSNPQGAAFEAIQDVRAFGTCP